MSKVSYYIKWKGKRGKHHTKSYGSIAGRNYWEQKIRKEFGNDAVIELGKESIVNGKTQTFAEGKKEKLLGPVDLDNSRMSGERTRRFVLSNWNWKTQTYTSRLYGGLNEYYKVIEPDGTISLEGRDIIKSTKGKVRTLTDGRKFDLVGWVVD